MTIENAERYKWYEGRKPFELYPGSCVAYGLDIAFEHTEMPEAGYKLASENSQKRGRWPIVYQGLLDIVWDGISEWDFEQIDKPYEPDALHANKNAYATDDFENFERLVEISRRTGAILLPYYRFAPTAHVECLLASDEGYRWGFDVIWNPNRYSDLYAKWMEMPQNNNGERQVIIFPPEPKG